MSESKATSESKLRKCLYLYLGETVSHGLGLFTARSIPAGKRIIVDDDGDYFDRIYSFEELRAHGYDLHNDAVQVGKDAFVTPNENLDDFMNHSCEPNCGVCFTPGGYYVTALRAIRRDEQLTYDYSTQMSFNYPPLQCSCGAKTCRGVVDSFETLPTGRQDYYMSLGIVADFAVEAALAGRS